MSERMDWKKLLAPFRRHSNGVVRADEMDKGRSPFQQDQDRILFTSPFRRMGKKAQVHPLIDNDHIHTRLTHSLEVASVGRSLGYSVGLKIAEMMPEALPDSRLSPIHMGEIVHAACLAHDLGNPPFGHAGEFAIQEFFRQGAGKEFCSSLKAGQCTDLKLFDGNAMGFRMLVQTEMYRFAGGMRLTYPVLGSMLKYPWASRHAEDVGKKKFSCFSSEISIMDDVAEHLGMIKLEDHHYARHPLAWLVEAADDICYSILDIEDAFELRILSFPEIRAFFEPKHPWQETFAEVMGNDAPDRDKVAWIRGTVIRVLVSAVVDAFASPEHYPRIMDGSLSPDADLVDFCGDGLSTLVSEAKTLGKKRIYNHPRKLELEIGGEKAVFTMLELFCSAVSNRGGQSYRDSKVMKLLGERPVPHNADDYTATMCFLDYLAGMTDQYATYINRQFSGMGEPGITR